MTLDVGTSRDLRLLAPGGEWDELLRRSRSDTIFLASGWLRAAHNAFGGDAEPLVVRVRRDGALIGAATFLDRQGDLELLGAGPSDYLDVLLDRDLDDGDALAVTRALLDAALQATPRFRGFRLGRLVSEWGTPSRLAALAGLHVARTFSEAAPSMEMHAAAEAVRKKSLRRKENKLRRAGELRTTHHTTAEDILPRLEGLFELHEARWEESQFADPAQRVFFRRLVQELGPTGTLRFTEVHLDDALVAVHLGFSYAGRFTWYKPSYNPEFADYGPGEVLLKHLIEQAIEEGVDEFDFTIGREFFKTRFATVEREVVDLYVTDSWTRKVALEGRLQAKETIKGVLAARGWWDPVKRAWTR